METPHALDIFASVVRTGSFSAAARELGTSPASVFRQMNQLESEFGVRLITRSSREISLTDVGRAFLEQTNVVIRDVGKLRLIANEHSSGMKGVFHIHARSASGTAIVVPMLSTFRAKYPDVHLRISMSDHHPNLVDQNIDLSIVNELPEATSLVSRKLASWQRRVCASPSYLKHRGIPRSPSELKDHQCVTYLFNLGAPRWRFRKSGVTEVVSPSSVVQTTDWNSMQKLALGGVGIIMLPEWYVGESIRQGEMVRLFEPYECAPNMVGGFQANVWALYHQSRRKSHLLRAFLDELVHSLKRHGANNP